VAISDDVFRRIQTASYALHRHRQAASWPSWLVRTVAQTIACDSAMLVSIEPARHDLDIVAWPEQATPGHDGLFDLHARDHPFVAHCALSRSARAFRLCDLVSGEAFESTGLYRTVYRGARIRHQLMILVASPGADWRALVLNRAHHEFDEEDRLALEALWPHVMLVERRLRHDRPDGGDGLLQTAAQGRAGVAVITTGCQVSMCSEQARIWLASYFGGTHLAGPMRLPEPVMHWARQRIANELQGRRLRVVRRDPLVATLGRCALVLDLVVDHGKDMHLLTLDEIELSAPPASLHKLGLTARECEVLSWVAQGKTNREIGLILDASARTVQKHLEHIFQKVGVETRTAATLRAWQAADVPLLGDGVTRPSSRR